MKFNLKNPLWAIDPVKAKKGFEKELREILIKDEWVSPREERRIKEILGE